MNTGVRKMTEAIKCFVIMPFSETTKERTEEYWTEHFEKYLKPLIEWNGTFMAKRSSPLREDILRGIISELVSAPIVVADLTDWNANVFWELGVRQSFKHGTITIKSETTPLPFDVSLKATLSYSESRLKNAEFDKKFKEALMDCINNPLKSDSHVLEAISGRGSIYQIITREETLRKIDGLFIELENNLDLYERVSKRCAENLKGESKRKMASDRPQSACQQLLATTRYLALDSKIYKLVVDSIGDAAEVNEKLMKWFDSTDWAEKRLTAILPNIISRIQELKLEIKESKAQIELMI